MNFWGRGRSGLCDCGGGGLLVLVCVRSLRERWNEGKRAHKKGCGERNYFRSGADGHLALAGLGRNVARAMREE